MDEQPYPYTMALKEFDRNPGLKTEHRNLFVLAYQLGYRQAEEDLY